MTCPAKDLAGLLGASQAVIRMEIIEVRGSSPREEGAEMFVAPNAKWGTIGGGQLEYRAINAARSMIADGALNRILDIQLGAEIGQCCGGRVKVSLSRMRASDQRDALDKAMRVESALPRVYVMGAGHVGRALARLLQHLPVRCIVVDQRPEEVALCDADVETRVSVIPEFEIMTAPKGSAFIVLTHDHGLDFLLTATALELGDATYVGMIGSATKRVKLRNWMRDHCDMSAFEQLVCPMGATGSRDKRPAVIAAFVAAEVMAAIFKESAVHQVPSHAVLPDGMEYQPGR